MEQAHSDSHAHWRKQKEVNRVNWEHHARHDVVPSHKYVNDFLQLGCAPELVALKIFPNSKEIAESFAAYRAVQKHLPSLLMNDPSITMIAVGDGHVPRTATTFAFRTAWMCHSVDPCMRPLKKCFSAVNRLQTHAKRADEVCLSDVTGRVVIVAVHSHASFESALAMVPNASDVSMVVLPCCKINALPAAEFDVAYNDAGIPSPDNTVYVYNHERIACFRM